jgi:glucose/arabinose dehydrogenase
MPLTRYEAEDAELFGAEIKNYRAGASNSYVDYANNVGDYIEWSVDAETEGSYALSFRYGLGSSGTRALELSLNGVVVPDLLSFDSTGSWDTWTTLQQNVDLLAGTNTIRLSTIGDSGPNIDYLETEPVSGGTGEDTSPYGEYFEMTYEAEDAVVVGAAIQGTHAGASGQYVDYVNNTGDYTEWTVNVTDAGQYELAFQYALASAGTRAMQLTINGEVQTDLVDFASTASWSTWQSVIETLNLQAGQNIIRLEAVGDSGPNLDYMKVTSTFGEDTTGGGGGEDTTGGGGETAPFDMTYEAEDAVVVGAEIKNYRPGASGEYVDYANNTGDYIEWTVDMDEAGDYNLAFQYAQASSATRSMQLSINGVVQANSVDFASTGSWESWDAATQTLNLEAGSNVIRLEASGDSGPNIDYLRITNDAAGEDTTGGGGGEDTTGGGGGEDTTGGGGEDTTGGGEGEWQDVMFNFQNNSNNIPSGYIKDYGQGYDDARGYGWVTEESLINGTHEAIDITTSGRDRNLAGYDQRVDTFVHMEDFDAGFSAGWEYALENGFYAVTVSVGDGIADDVDGFHTINIEGQTVIDRFNGTPEKAHAIETAVLEVTDGKLTIDSIGGDKTKINFVEIEKVDPDTQPTIASANPVDDATDVNRSYAVTFDVSLVEVGVGVDGASLTNATVSLYETNGMQQIEGNLNTSGGGDTIIFKPTVALDANTNYTLMIDGAADTNGTEFIPYTTSFTTGEAVEEATGQHDLTVAATGEMAISLMISPDNSQLYATTVDGKILRWDIDESTGALSNKQTFLGLQGNPEAPAAIIGMAFDPNDPNTLWVSHNASYFTHADDFTGQISKLHLAEGDTFNATIEQYIVGLPRSNHDHMTNSLSFGPDGHLYVTQGSNTAMGDLDTAWGDRPERALTAAMLEIDPNVETNGVPINVQTENYINSEGIESFGDYAPYAEGAPVTVYATGLRNAYDHVWHSNGNLYVPDNGSAAGGVVPDDPNTAYNEQVRSVHSQHDVLYKMEEGYYYGHPNASRGEYILRGGNPTEDIDPGEVSARNGFKGYEVGVMPDPDYQPHVFDFGDKQSADGIIELKSDLYGEGFQHSLLVVRYSAGNDIVSIQLDAEGNVVDSAIFASDLVNPLDLVEHTPSGRIYLAEFRGFESKISMFTPTGESSGGDGETGGGTDDGAGTDTNLFGVYEAELADYTGPVFRNHYDGYTGSGFLDVVGNVDDYIEWTVDNADAGLYHIALRYALGSSTRSMDLYVNNELVADNFVFENTGTWADWQEAGLDVELQEGINTIRIEADGNSGPNFDSLIISQFDFTDPGDGIA